MSGSEIINRHFHQPAEERAALEVVELTGRQHDILDFTSLGCTVKDMSAEFNCEVEQVAEVQAELLDLFAAPNMAAAVNRAIQLKKLEVEQQPEPARVQSLTERQLGVLGFIAAGFSNKQIGQIFGKQHSTFQKNVIRPIFGKIGANGRTHAVRRSYELGIFELAERSL